MRLRVVWFVAFISFFLMGAAWAIALPVNGTYDEKQHIVRAYAVMTGQWLPHGVTTDATGLRTGAFEAPRSLLPEGADCTWHPKPPRPASCQVPVTDRTSAPMPSAAARYSPVYYSIVGLPLLISPDATGVVYARLLSALLGAVLLALALAAAVRVGSRLLVTGVALTATPLAMNLNGAVNPNGVEVSAGVALFVALFALVRGGYSRWGVTLAAVASLLLLTARHSGPLLWMMVVAATAVVERPQQVRRLVRNRTAWAVLGGAAAAGIAFTLVWTYAARVTQVADFALRRQQLGVAEILAGTVTERYPFYARQVIGQFGYGETTISPVAVLLWYGLLGAVVLPALRYGGWRVRVAVLGLLTCSVAILTALELYYVPLVGWYSHGRYVLPAAVGVVLLAAASDRFADRFDRYAWLPAALALGTVPVHLYALVRVISRYRVGIEASLQPFDGSWRPPLGALPPLLACLGGTLLLVAVVAVGTRGRVVTSGVEPAAEPALGSTR